MARLGMTTIIHDLRTLTNSTPDDITLNDVTYWSDDHLQAELDTVQRLWQHIPLIACPDVINGATETRLYRIPTWLEGLIEENATDSGWAVRDSNGVDAPAYTVNYQARTITFAADTGGLTYYLSCRTYDVYRAAAAIWRRKAAFVHAAVDWSSDNHTLAASQEYAHCLEMALHYALLAGPRIVPLVRRDEIGFWGGEPLHEGVWLTLP